MTTDTDALTERIARALVLSPYVRGQLSKIGPVMKRREAERTALAAAVLPIVAAEVRKVKAEAWDEGAHAQANTYGGQIDTGPNPYRETGDSDDRR